MAASAKKPRNKPSGGESVYPQLVLGVLLMGSGKIYCHDCCNGDTHEVETSHDAVHPEMTLTKTSGQLERPDQERRQSRQRMRNDEPAHREEVRPIVAGTVKDETLIVPKYEQKH